MADFSPSLGIQGIDTQLQMPNAPSTPAIQSKVGNVSPTPSSAINVPQFNIPHTPQSSQGSSVPMQQPSAQVPQQPKAPGMMQDFMQNLNPSIPKAEAETPKALQTSFTKDDVTKLLDQGHDYGAIFQQAMLRDPEFAKNVNYAKTLPDLAPNGDQQEQQFEQFMVSNQYLNGENLPPVDPNAAAIAQSAQDSAGQKPPSNPLNSILGYLGKTASNIPSDTGQMIGGIVQSIMHPIQTAKSLGEAAIGVGQQIDTLLPKQVQLPEANSPFLDKTNQIGKNIVSELGNAVQHPLQTFQNHPVQTIAALLPISDAAGVSDLVSKVPAVARVQTLMDAAKSAPVALAKGAIGIQSGAGKAAVSEAFKGSQEFIEGMRGNEAEQFNKIISDVQNGMNTLYQNKANQYVAQKAGIYADTTIIPASKVQGILADTMKSFGIGDEQANFLNRMKGMSDTEATDFLNSMLKNNAVDQPLDPLTKAGISNASSANKISKAMTITQNWEDYTPKGLDNLHKALTDIGAQPHTTPAAFITKLDNGVKGLVKEANPQYAKMLNDYHTASAQIEDLTKALSTNSSPETIIRKLTATMRTGNQGFAMRNALLEDLQNVTGINIKGRIAGTAMNAAYPRGLQANLLTGEGLGIVAAHLFNPALIPALIFASPRAAGEILRVMGVTQRKIQPVIDALKMKAKIILPALGFSGEQTANQ